jgi:hypothetical protein
MKDPMWIYGFSLLAILAAMGFTFGLGKVESQTSHGLLEIIAILAGLTGQWAGKMFGGK